MTNDKNLKKAIRAYAEAHQVKYTVARRAVLESLAAGAPPPTPPGSSATAAADDEYPSPPSAEDLVAPVLEDLFAQLVNEPIGAYGIPLPTTAPSLRDPRVSAVEPQRWTLEVDFVEDYDGDTMSNVTMKGAVQLKGELDHGDASAAVADGTALFGDSEGDESVESTVVLVERHTLQIEAAILHESVAELADLQEVFARTWAD